MNLSLPIVCTLLMCFASTTTLRGSTYYVDDNATNDPGPGDVVFSDPDENGSIDHPFDAIQEAINAAGNDDEVIVLDGNYSGSGNNSIRFFGKNIVVRSVNGASTCTIVGPFTFGFLLRDAELETATLQGFTIRNGSIGVRFQNNSAATIRDCVISNQTSRGIFSEGGAAPRIENVTVENCAGGAIVAVGTPSPKIVRCTIKNNIGGGGIRLTNSNTLIANCMIFGNRYTLGGGGGVRCDGGAPTIRHCTIADNWALDAGGGVLNSSSQVTINHSIVWGNDTDSHTDISLFGFSAAQVSYSNVEGGAAGNGNINLDPRFMNPESQDYHLRGTSPCIARGDTMFVPVEGDYDIDGEPRLATCRTDLGGDEVTFVSDCNQNGLPDVCDILEGLATDQNMDWVPDLCGPISVDDCNGNGLLDYLEVRVPQFEETRILDAEPNSAAIGDFDQDGYKDVISMGDKGVVHLNNGATAFSLGDTFWDLGPGHGTLNHRSMAIADLNADGQPDMVAARPVTIYYNIGYNIVSPFQWYGFSSNTSTTHFVTPSTGFSDSYVVEVGDIDQDGDLDIAVAAAMELTGPGAIVPLLNNGHGAFQAAAANPVGNTPRSALLVDLDEDTDLDIVAANQYSEFASVLLNKGKDAGDAWLGYNTQLEYPMTTISMRAFGARTADFDRDGDEDVIIVHSQSSEDGVITMSLLANSGVSREGTWLGFEAPQEWVVESGSALSSVCAEVFDWNGDGWTDVATVQQFSDTVAIFTNRGLINGTWLGFDEPHFITVGNYPAWVGSGDIDRDGRMDLVIANRGASLQVGSPLDGIPSVSILLNRSRPGDCNHNGILDDCELGTPLTSAVTNGEFESATLDGWVVTPPGSWVVNNGTVGPACQGFRDALTSNNASTSAIYQELIVPSSAPYVSLSWMDRIAWSVPSNPVLAIVRVTLRDTNNAVLRTLSYFDSWATGFESLSTPCTQHIADISEYVGQTIRFHVETVEPSNTFTVHLDSVRIFVPNVDADCDRNGVVDDCDLDCNQNEVADRCEIDVNLDMDANANAVIDSCERRLHVNKNVQSPGSGESWSNALPEVSDALLRAERDPTVTQIWVAAGDYLVDPKDRARASTLRVRDQLAIYGGFEGNEELLSERDLSVHPTMLDGDLLSNDFSPGVGCCDANNSTPCTATGCRELVCQMASTCCGATWLQTCDAIARYYCKGECMPFNDNSYRVVSILDVEHESVIDGFVIANANASYHSAVENGGGIFVADSEVVVRNSTLRNNKAFVGGGVFSTASDVRIENSLIVSNGRATGAPNISLAAGVVGCEGSVSLTNSTVFGNSDEGLISLNGSDLTAANSIVWGNDEDATFTGFTYCCVDGNSPGTGNINANPQFEWTTGVDNVLGTADDDFRLSRTSPCIDAGNNELLPSDSDDLDNDGDTMEPVPVDLAGQPRIMDEVDVADTGVGAAAIVDMGANERIPDCNSNRQPDFEEIALNSESDCDGDGRLDICNLSTAGTSQFFASGWMFIPQDIVKSTGSYAPGYFVPDFSFDAGRLLHVPPRGGLANVYVNNSSPVGAAFAPHEFTGTEERLFVAQRTADNVVRIEPDGQLVLFAANLIDPLGIVYVPSSIGGPWANHLITTSDFPVQGSDYLGSIYAIDSSGSVTTILSPVGLGVWTPALTPSNFGEFANHVLVGSIFANKVLALDLSDGQLRQFASLPFIAGETGVRQIAVSPIGWAAPFAPETAEESVLAISISGESSGLSGTGSLVIVDQRAQVLAIVRRGVHGETFNPRGLLFDDYDLLISDINTHSVIRIKSSIFDCNENGQLDYCDIALGISTDTNLNTAVDECEFLGDFDLDGDVDLLDYANWPDCLTGPSAFMSGPACDSADIHSDQHVDLSDFAHMLELFEAND